ncbi:MAG TPA: hypothetical protein VFS58_17205 [Steroidobacteraceae bacterium]|nr:hypothetical protein [Steroidobacteraceae bacterium]
MKTRLEPLAAIFALVSITATSLAATVPTVKRTLPNMTSAQLQQRLAPVLSVQRQQLLGSLQRAQSDADVAFKALAPERAALNKALAADPRYQTYLSRANAIGKGGGKPAEKVAQLKALATANRSLFDEATRTAKIDRASIQSKIGKGTLNQDFSLLLRTSSKARVGILRAPPAPVPTDLVYEPPYDFENVETENGGLAYQAATGNSNADTGKSRADSTVVGVAGTADVDAEVGKTISVPAGVNRMQITVNMRGVYSASAASALSASMACAHYELVVVSLKPDSRVSGYDYEGECVIAPFAWYAEADGESTKDHVFTVEVPQNDRDFVIMARASVLTTAGGLPGYSEASAKAEPKKIRVKYLTQ